MVLAIRHTIHHSLIPGILDNTCKNVDNASRPYILLLAKWCSIVHDKHNIIIIINVSSREHAVAMDSRAMALPKSQFILIQIFYSRETLLAFVNLIINNQLIN